MQSVGARDDDDIVDRVGGSRGIERVGEEGAASKRGQAFRGHSKPFTPAGRDDDRAGPER